MKFHTTEESKSGLFICFEDENDQGETERLKLPAVYEVCPSCQGHGTSSAYLGDWTASEWGEEDYEFQENYMAGRYDRPCPECGGKRVVAVPQDRDYLTSEDLKIYDRFHSRLEDGAYFEAEQRAENWMREGY